MKYKDALRKSMEVLAQDSNVIFIGYNVCRGSEAYGTLKGVPKNQKLEMPVAENLMAGLAHGISLEGTYKPVVFFERQDFILNALDAIVNHIDKIKDMSCGQYVPAVIVRATVGSKTPLYPGLQHTQDFTRALRLMTRMSVYDPKTSREVLKVYQQLRGFENSAIVVERKELYEIE